MTRDLLVVGILWQKMYHLWSMVFRIVGIRSENGTGFTYVGNILAASLAAALARMLPTMSLSVVATGEVYHDVGYGITLLDFFQG